MGAKSRHKGRVGARDLKRFRAFTARTIEDLEPLDVISADGHCFKAEVRHPLHGGAFRPEIVTVIDIATRKVIGWSAGLAESALVVADALRIAALWKRDAKTLPAYVGHDMDREARHLAQRRRPPGA